MTLGEEHTLARRSTLSARAATIPSVHPAIAIASLLASAAPKPELAVAVEPATALSSSAIAPCRVQVVARVTNRGRSPVLIEALELRWGDRAVHHGFDPPVRVDP